ncbi:MAG: hypothetical protein HQK75_18120 [Candidatus Magnetomorum sp.]|nr:hypothetical protein [Candidatus Magnetomorum sp.]
MSIEAVLTYGWERQEGVISACEMDTLISQRGGTYETELLKKMQLDYRLRQFDRVDDLFRRRASGFKKINHFIAALIQMNTVEIVLYIDVFAYNLLKSAKNFDLFLPEKIETTCKNSFRKIYPEWMKEIKSLKSFERCGKKTLPKTKQDDYLKFRNIISRESARDEKRTLCALLLSGPSTLEDISVDLGLNHSLTRRTTAAFERIEVIEKKRHLYFINKKAIPMVLFGLQEDMGVDFLKGIN